MVELQKKYQIGTRRFGLVNWVGTYSLFKKEVLRFLTVSGQTLFGPILTSILFLTVISLAIGDQRADVLGCLLYTSPSPRDATLSRMPSSA